MADIVLTRGKTLPNNGDKADLHDLVDLTTATISNIVNADVSASAAIAGSKINPNFGSQNMSTTGDCDFGSVETDTITLDGNAVDTAGGLGTYSTLVLDSIDDYATSASSSTAKDQSALKICYGTVTVGANASQAITNLPFTSATSYSVVASYSDVSGTIINPLGVNQDSGSQFTIHNGEGASDEIQWQAIGT